MAWLVYSADITVVVKKEEGAKVYSLIAQPTYYH
jgi:hypothetical protein